jgi:predicted nucleotidyltransferase
MDKEEILKKLFDFKQKNAGKYGIKNIGIFGSFSLEKADTKSDIDIVLETSKVDLFLLVHLKEELEHLLNKKVDIVRYRKRMNKYLKKHIDEDAIYV